MTNHTTSTVVMENGQLNVAKMVGGEIVEIIICHTFEEAVAIDESWEQASDHTLSYAQLVKLTRMGISVSPYPNVAEMREARKGKIYPTHDSIERQRTAIRSQIKSFGS